MRNQRSGFFALGLLLSACTRPAPPAAPPVELASEPASVDFGITEPGRAVQREAQLLNQGLSSAPATLEVVDDAAGAFRAQPLPTASVPGGGSTSLVLRYVPSAAGRHSAVLRVLSSGREVLRIALAGEAAGPELCERQSCETPPSSCHQPAGVCVDGTCRYTVRSGACDDADPCTVDDTCTVEGSCTGKPKCASPPPSHCIDGQTLRAFAPLGTCEGGHTCRYTAVESSCEAGCNVFTGACRPRCSPGQHECDATCVPDDATASCGRNCSPCLGDPNGVPACIAGACSFVCSAGFRACSRGCRPCPAYSDGTQCTPAPPYDEACIATSCGAGHLLCGSKCCRPAGQVSLGSTSGCALSLDGGLSCWGPLVGQMPDVYDPLLPVPIAGVSTVGQVSTGYHHTCVVTGSGGAKCWGENSAGELGDGTTQNRMAPVDVIGLDSGVTSIAVGTFHSCAATAAGAAFCWGDNALGNLGDGTTVSRSTPAPVALDAGVRAVAAGYSTSCALTLDGRVFCWGWGQLNGEGTGVDRSSPVAVELDAGATAIDVKGYHACALLTGGRVKCWGRNSRGELGDGTNTPRLSPVDVVGLPPVTTVATSVNPFSCAIDAANSLWCWGEPPLGPLAESLTPIQFPEFQNNARGVALGQGVACVIALDSRVWCWGYPTAAFSFTPQLLEGI